MRLTHIRLLVTDFPAMRAFYRDALGLRISFDDGENFAEVEAGGDVGISLFVRHGMDDAVDGGVDASGGDRSVLVFEVEDVDAVHARLMSRGVAFVAGPRDMPDWGIRIALFRDPEGSLLEINQALARN